MARLGIFLGFFLMLSLAFLYDVLVIDLVASSSLSELNSETYDLRISQALTEVVTKFQRTIILSKLWDQIILNMSVQNFGDHLDSILLKVTANGVPIQASFSASEEVGLVQAISYQFEVPQTLVITLNSTEQTLIQLELIISLDFGVTLGDPDVNFLVKETQLIAIDLVQPWEKQILPLYHAKHQYQIQPVRYSFLKKKLKTTPVLFVNIPPDMRLDYTVSVTLHGTNFNSLTINDLTFYPSKSDFMINLNLTKTGPLISQALFQTMVISPDYEGLDGLSQVVVETTVAGMLEPLSNLPIDSVLGSHPVPGIIMLPFLLASLFGIPYYMVYQEHVSNRDKNILDPQKQTKL